MEYKLIRSSRKTLSIRVTGEGVEVRAPQRIGIAVIEAFVQSKANWIRRALAAQPPMQPPFTPQELKDMKQQACADLKERVAFYAPILQVSYGRITLRSQKTRWGSCSGKGNLNFNCLLMQTPPEVRDYVVVHELCHLLEMNHSPRFWALVEGVLPDYRNRRQWLKLQGRALIARLL